MNQRQYQAAIENDLSVQAGKDSFFRHVEHCTQCTTGRCNVADQMWRNVLVQALAVVRDAARAQQKGA